MASGFATAIAGIRHRPPGGGCRAGHQPEISQRPAGQALFFRVGKDDIDTAVFLLPFQGGAIVDASGLAVGCRGKS